MDPSLFALHVWHCLRMRLCWQMLPPPHSLPQMESLELQALWVQTVKSNLVKLLEVWRHRVVIICLARLERAPYPIVLADAPPSALLARAPSPQVLADAASSALLALAPSPSVPADARPSALLARAPLPIVLTWSRLRPSCWLPHPRGSLPRLCLAPPASCHLAVISTSLLSCRLPPELPECPDCGVMLRKGVAREREREGENVGLH